jgi:hypothetical protein
MRVSSNVLYGLVATLMLFSVSVAIQKTVFSAAPEQAGEGLVRPAARVVARPVSRDAVSSADEEDGSMDAAAGDSARPAVRRGPATSHNAAAAPDQTMAASSRTSAQDEAASDPPARAWSNPLSALRSLFSSGGAGAARAPATVASPPASTPPASPQSGGAQTNDLVQEVSFAASAEKACQPGGREFVLDDLRGLYVCIGWAGPVGTSAPQLTFLSPDGNVYQTMTLPVVTAEALETVATLPVAGTYISQHSLAGRWMVKISLNGKPVNQDHFILQAKQ